MDQKRLTLQAGVADYAVFDHWQEIAGDHLAAVTRPLRVQGRVLWVHVPDSTLLYHLTYLAPQMLRRVHEVEPACRIRSIRFTLSSDL